MLLTVNEVAEYLRWSPEQVRKLARRKELPAHKLGNGPRAEYRFFQNEIIKWVKEGGK